MIAREQAERYMLGYLVVLNDQVTLAALTPTEIQIGEGSIVGSLVKLEEYLEEQKSPQALELLTVIESRERLNGSWKFQNDPRLAAETHTCAMRVFEYYKCAWEGL